MQFDRFRWMTGLLASVALLVAFAASVPSALAQRTPEKELAALRPAADVQVSLFAAEPMITNPSAIDVDTPGRVWVAEIQWYRAAAKEPPADKIKVLEDTDGDGRPTRPPCLPRDSSAP